MRIVGVCILVSLFLAFGLSGCTRAYRQTPEPVPTVEKQGAGDSGAAKVTPRVDPRSKSLFEQYNAKKATSSHKPSVNTSGMQTKGPIVVIYPGQ